MKRIGLLIAVIGALTFSNDALAQKRENKASSGPAIETSRDSYSFGTITEGDNGEGEFTITNSGDEPLIISECNPSCDCISVKCPTTAIAPGATVQVRFVYDTSKLGSMSNTIILISNAVNTNTTGPGTYRLTISGTVEASTGPVLKK